MMTGKMGTRGSTTMKVKKVAGKSRRKTVKAPENRSKSPMRRMNSKSSTKKIQHRRPKSVMGGDQCDIRSAHPLKNKSLTKTLTKNNNNEEMATPKKRVRRPAAKSTVPRMKKNVIRHARQTTRKRSAAMRKKAATGKNAHVC